MLENSTSALPMQINLYEPCVSGFGDGTARKAVFGEVREAGICRPTRRKALNFLALLPDILAVAYSPPKTGLLLSMKGSV